MARHQAINRHQVPPGERVPSNPDDLETIKRAYPRSIQAIVRELSVYKLASKSDGHPIEAQWRFGIALGIIDHILKAGELRGDQ